MGSFKNGEMGGEIGNGIFILSAFLFLHFEGKKESFLFLDTGYEGVVGIWHDLIESSASMSE